jgi:CSLREA domain-containing protein
MSEDTLRGLAARLVIAALGVVLSFAAGSEPHAAHGAGASFTVNSTADTVDATPGDSTCADATGACTLRAAVMEANAHAIPSVPDTIDVPPGTYILTLSGAGEDLGAAGDLDITNSLTVRGSGAGVTIIDGGGLDRVFHARVPPDLDYIEVVVSDITIQNGVATDPDIGGGAFAVASPWALVYIDRAAITGNQAVNQPGGGVYSAGFGAIRESTLSNNSGLRGGAVYYGGLNYGWSVLNSTLSNNAAASGGCALEAEPTPGLARTLVSVTVSGGASSPGCTSQIVGPWNMRRTIVATGSTGFACSGAVISVRDNLDSDGSCGLTGPGDLSNVDPKLGPLAGNGGPTLTHALLAGSPAIDAAHDVEGELCDQLNANDQRGAGFPRRVDGNGDGIAVCDIGAFELQEAPPKPTAAPTRAPQQFAGSLPQTGGRPAAGGGGIFGYAAIAVASIAIAGGWWAYRRHGHTGRPAV